MNIILMTTQGYGHKFSANNSKSEFIALGLMKQGCQVTIFNSPQGTFECRSLQQNISSTGIKYVDFKDVHQKTWKNYHDIKTKLIELKKPNEENHIIIGFKFFPTFLMMCHLAKEVGYTRSTLFHEWHIQTKTNNVILWLDNQLKDRTFGYFLDGILPISHYLEEKSKKFKRPTMILPVMASYVRNSKKTNDLIYFTFCADAAYLTRNSLILEAFSIVVAKYPLVQLILVLSGRQSDFELVKRKIINLNIENSVLIKSQIPQSELFDIYDNAVGLLVPLQPNSVQDIARFSQKIAEYVGSKRPIITNCVGEIPYYFVDNESALFADYTAKGFADCMCDIVEHPLKASNIGMEGYKVGIKHFDYVVNATKLIQFIKKLKN